MKTKLLRNTLATIVTLFTALFALPQTAMAQTKEAYVVKSTDGMTLTFYYDDQRATRTGTVYGIDQKRTDNGNVPAWAGAYSAPEETLTKAVFDASFKDYKPTNTSRWFSYCKKIETIEGMANLNTAQVTNMYEMFRSCEALTSLDVSNFNTANVTNMSNVFFDCKALNSLDVSKFNTENVINMSYMFYGCKNLSSLDVSNFNTAKVTNMNFMFCECQSLTTLDVTNFNTANVTDMSHMFYGCQALTSLDVTNFNTEKVTDMSFMFYKCEALTSLDVSKFNTAKVTSMSSMFFRCIALTSLDVTNFNTEKVANMSYMFSGCHALKSLDVTNFNTTNVINMNYMFNECEVLTSLDISNFNTANVTQMSNMFKYCKALTTIYCDNDWNSGKSKESTDMFKGSTKLKGAVPYDESRVGIEMANPTTGYFTPSTGIVTPASEAYVVKSTDGMTLTFYYDDQRATRTGTVYGIAQKRADNSSIPAWVGTSSAPEVTLTKAVFDASFKDYSLPIRANGSITAKKSRP